MAIPVTATGKQKYIKKIIKKRAIHKRNKERTKEPPHGQAWKVEAFTDQSRYTTPHRNNATFITGKQQQQQNKTFGIMHQNIENKGNKSSIFWRMGNSLEIQREKIRRLQASGYIEIVKIKIFQTKKMPVQ